MSCKHCNGEHLLPVTGKELELPLKSCSNPECVDFGKAFLPVEAKFCPRCGQKISVENLPQESLETVFCVNGVEFEMVYVEGGTFDMGSDDSVAEEIEKPVHRVTLSSYRIGKYLVTQDLWHAVMGDNPSCFEGPRLPVDSVSWYDCQEFIRELNRLTGENFKLPTEAQWEFAARGGNKSEEYKYPGCDDIYDIMASCFSEVGERLPNELGLYDMSGYVEQWCYDFYNGYSTSPQTDPTGSSIGDWHVLRGASRVCYSGHEHRVSYRSMADPKSDRAIYGLRLCI